MKKLTLKLDELHVESFDTISNGTAARGTVEAQVDPDYAGQTMTCFSCAGTCDMSECYGNSCGMTCDTCNGSCFGTCDYSCETCGFSCNGTCGGGTCYC